MEKMTKKWMKKLTSMVAIGAAGLALAACGNEEADGEASGQETVNIGILQFMEHNSLTAAKDGFVSELEDAGYTDGENMTIDLMNAQGDQANLQSMSEQLASNNDLMLAIATPAAQS